MVQTQSQSRKRHSPPHATRRSNWILDCILLPTQRQLPPTQPSAQQTPPTPNVALSPFQMASPTITGSPMAIGIAEARSPEPDRPMDPMPENGPTPPNTPQLVAELSHLDHRALTSSLRFVSQDVDKWEIVMRPKVYLERFGDPLAVVQLASHASHRLLAIAQHSDLKYWMLLASSAHQIWIESKYKTAFFAALKIYQTVQPSPCRFQASLGQVVVPVSLFVRCLNKATCTALVIKVYGHKLPILNNFLPSEPAQVSHPLARYNEWDIGSTVKSDHIWLFGTAHGTTLRHPSVPHDYPGI